VFDKVHVTRLVLKALGLGIALCLAACQTAPISGRNQLILMSAERETSLGAEAYQKIRDEQDISNDPELNRRMNEVGRRVAAASDAPNLPWEFTLFEDDSANAFALPSGKVGVNTGLFDVAKNDAQLAAVLAHEIGHVLARHSSERMSRQLLVQGGLAAFGLGMGGNSQAYVQLASQAATLGVVLPFTREQESEADRIGLIYMARAGYDPRQAVELWRNFEAAGGERPPEFLSTHPAPGTRIQQLQQYLPEAVAIYQQNGG
jgi:predicted Zn-dependent protease